MRLVDVAIVPPTIATTLRAMEIPLHAPPSAAARCRSRSLLDIIHDWEGATVNLGWPD